MTCHGDESTWSPAETVKFAPFHSNVATRTPLSVAIDLRISVSFAPLVVLVVLDVSLSLVEDTAVPLELDVVAVTGWTVGAKMFLNVNVSLRPASGGALGGTVTEAVLDPP